MAHSTYVCGRCGIFLVYISYLLRTLVEIQNYILQLQNFSVFIIKFKKWFLHLCFGLHLFREKILDENFRLKFTGSENLRTNFFFQGKFVSTVPTLDRTSIFGPDFLLPNSINSYLRAL